jgi:hypothetical protein
MITGKKRKSSKYVFTLKGVDTEKVDKIYGITLISNITNIDSQPCNITKLTELSENSLNKPQQLISFLDESKKIYQCNISMVDYKTGIDLERNKYNCFWCRHIFNSIPIGCPINYVSSKAIKNYHSEVSKDNYTIKENITTFKRKLLDSKKKFIFTSLTDKINTNLNINKEEYYQTDGIFCSFNCCKAFIKDNKHNRLYEQSEFLLNKIYNDISGSRNININEAPHWRMLEEYGGNLTINQFRENFNKISYEYHGIIKSDIFKPIGILFEEKINF